MKMDSIKISCLIALCIVILIPSAELDNPFVECCGLNLMDSNMQVAIEDRPLPTGTFRALIVRVCTTDPVYIQIWTKITNGLSGVQYQLKWQNIFTPTYNQTVQTPTIFTLSPQVSISTNDRLGLYNPTNTNLKFAIPYVTNQSVPMYFSANLYPDASVFTTGSTTITVQDFSWTRSFGTYMKFCNYPNQCPTVPSDAPASPPYSPYSDYITIPASCCASRVSCDAGNQISNSLNTQTDQVTQLLKTIQSLQNILNGLLNSQIQTGYCVDGYKPGVYGVGFCYKLVYTLDQQSQGDIACRDDGAHIVDIQSEAEDKFIKSLIKNYTNPSGPPQNVSFWTSAMYDLNTGNWNWYNSLASTYQPFGTYKNWVNQIEPAANNKLDVCALYTVDLTAGTDYWQKASCTDPHYFICKIPKKCY